MVKRALFWYDASHTFIMYYRPCCTVLKNDFKYHKEVFRVFRLNNNLALSGN